MNQPLAPSSSSSRLRLLAGLAQVALLSLSSLACATEPVRPMKTESSAELFTQIKTLIGDAACDSQDQCHTIAVGHKACGGPGSYLAWSSKNVDAAKLNELVRRQAAAEQAENQRAGMISDCRLVTDPGAVCRAGRCQLQTGAGAGTSAR